MRTAVFLLNMGGPDSMEAIRPFLRNLFSDPEIMRFPLASLVRAPLARFISKMRTRRVAIHYEAMGGKSPIKEITLAQARALEEKLGPDYSVHVAMRYWRPFAAEAVADAAAKGAERVIVLPLYPHFCRATTGSSINDLEGALGAGGLSGLPRRTVRSWETFPLYVEALAEGLREADRECGDAFFLFSAHGLPVKLIEGGDPYLRHIQATVKAVMEKFPGREHALAFQSRTGPVRWLEPSIDRTLHELASKGVRKIVVIAVSFVSDHIETLREIDVDYRALAGRLGISCFERAPSLNVRPAFIAALEALVLREAEAF